MVDRSGAYGTGTDRATERAIWLIGIGLLALYLLGASVLFRKSDGRVVFGDATHHYVQLRSLVFDHDLHFGNDYVRLYGLRGGEPDTEWVSRDLTPTGHVRNYMPIGPALLWAPLYLLIVATLEGAALVGWSARPDGFEHVLQLVPGITGVAAATVAVALTWRMTRHYVEAVPAAIGVLAVWLGTHALYYTVISPSYSHAASMLTSAAFFTYWLRTRDAPSTVRVVQWGGLVGIAALMRWQEAILLAVPILEILRSRRSLTRKATDIGAAIAAFLIAFLPQMAVWIVLYGKPLALPQGPGFMHWTDPHLFDVLVSDNHGLFSWTPLVLVATLGLGGFAVRNPGPGFPIAAVIFVSWYVNASVADWWGGEAFGARRFLSLFPLFALGVAWWLARDSRARARWRMAVTGSLIAANWLLLLQYQLFMKGFSALAPYPSGWTDMWLTRFAVPFRIARSWLS
jgi:hypothetical protein